jgi:PAS domain-containing protein
VNSVDAILVGGILLNKNTALIEHMREIIFPVGVLPGDAEGLTALHLEGTSVVVSRQRGQGQRTLGMRAAAPVMDTVLKQGDPWLGRIDLDGESYLAGYEPLLDGDGQRIGMLGVAIPNAPYQKAVALILAMTAGLLALTLLAISVLFLGAGRDMTQRLQRIVETMTRVSQGDRAARVGRPAREDELGQLTRHFDGLLDTIANQDEVRRAALKTIADEASRRRALFEHERDGVVILNEDGSVFEANPKCAAMLGYTPDALNQLRFSDWDALHSRAPAPADSDKSAEAGHI